MPPRKRKVEEKDETSKKKRKVLSFFVHFTGCYVHFVFAQAKGKAAEDSDAEMEDDSKSEKKTKPEKKEKKGKKQESSDEVSNWNVFALQISFTHVWQAKQELACEFYGINAKSSSEDKGNV